MMNKTIGILAHVDAGKTTFSENLLYHTHSIKKRGRVDHQNAFLDSALTVTHYSHTEPFSYDLCHNEQEVIEEIGHDKNADPEYTSSAIFCAKGQGFSVEWDEVGRMMHCL